MASSQSAGLMTLGPMMHGLLAKATLARGSYHKQEMIGAYSVQAKDQSAVPSRAEVTHLQDGKISADPFTSHSLSATEPFVCNTVVNQ